MVLLFAAVAECLKHDISAITGEDAVLPCAAKSKDGVQYRSVIWYKVKFSICMYFIENLVFFSSHLFVYWMFVLLKKTLKKTIQIFKNTKKDSLE